MSSIIGTVSPFGNSRLRDRLDPVRSDLVPSAPFSFFAHALNLPLPARSLLRSPGGSLAVTPTKLLIGQILIVFAIVFAGVWVATQWAAAMLGYQPAYDVFRTIDDALASRAASMTERR